MLLTHYLSVGGIKPRPKKARTGLVVVTSQGTFEKEVKPRQVIFANH
jgi:hypothetical protein